MPSQSERSKETVNPTFAGNQISDKSVAVWPIGLGIPNMQVYLTNREDNPRNFGSF